jgi:hypothetical protein
MSRLHETISETQSETTIRKQPIVHEKVILCAASAYTVIVTAL